MRNLMFLAVAAAATYYALSLCRVPAPDPVALALASRPALPAGPLETRHARLFAELRGEVR